MSFYDGYPDTVPYVDPTKATPTAGGPGAATITQGYLVNPIDIAKKQIEGQLGVADFQYTTAQIARALALLNGRTKRSLRDSNKQGERGIRNLVDPYLRNGLNNSGLTNTRFRDFRTDVADNKSDIFAEYDAARGELIAQRNEQLRRLARLLGVNETDLLGTSVGNLSNVPNDLTGG